MTEYSIAGARPNELLQHMIEKEYTLQGITPDAFVRDHAGEEFDLEALKSEFKRHVVDYGVPLVKDKASIAIHFCKVFMYTIGPESRKVRKGSGADKVWKLNTKINDVSHTVFIATYKQENAVVNQIKNDTTLSLTLKQAGLLCMETFTRLVKHAFSAGLRLLTPLAGACFSKSDMELMAKELSIPEVDLLAMVCCSTQSGGHYLTNSDVDIAVVAAIAATRNCKDEGIKKSIVTKTIKQYINKGRNPDKIRMSIIAKYATGGVPMEFSYDNLVNDFESTQRSVSLIRQKKIMEQSAIESIVTAPMRP
nr:NP [Wugcerasp virus 9]